MSNHSNQSTSKNGLGAVAREKYEEILRERVRRCRKAQESKISAHRAEAINTYLEQSGLANALRTYRSALEELIKYFGEQDWRTTVWLRESSSLLSQDKAREGVNAILRELAELKPVYEELKRLAEFDSQIAEKVWLAGAPEQIAEVLKEIGEPFAVETGADEDRGS